MNFLTRDYRTPTPKHCTYSGNRVDDGGARGEIPDHSCGEDHRSRSGSSGAYMECALSRRISSHF